MQRRRRLAAIDTSRVGVIDTRRVRPGPKAVEDFYGSAAWKAARDQVRRARGNRCERADGACSGRLMVDHIVERRDGGADLDPANLMVLCEHHHQVKTAQARAARLAR